MAEFKTNTVRITREEIFNFCKEEIKKNLPEYEIGEINFASDFWVDGVDIQLNKSLTLKI